MYIQHCDLLIGHFLSAYYHIIYNELEITATGEAVILTPFQRQLSETSSAAEKIDCPIIIQQVWLALN